VDYAEEMKITASTGLFLSYNCVGKLLSTTRNSSSFFCGGNDIAGGSNGGGRWGWRVGLI